MNAPRRIAFVVDHHPHPSKTAFLQAFRTAFAEYTVEVIDIGELLRGRSRWMKLANLACMLREYWRHLCLGDKKVGFYASRTTYLFRQMRRLIAERLQNGDFAFSVQMMLLFDAGGAGIPNFIYTDIVHLAYYDCPEVNRWNQNCGGWVALEREMYHRARRVFTWSNNMSQCLIDRYAVPEDRVTCVYTGANARAHSHTPVPDTRYASKNILFVGIDWVRKGGEELVAAFRRVLLRHPDAKLTVVGCVPEIDISNCRVLGRVPLDQVTHHYNQAAVFCLPTRREPFGSVFIEAMQHGLPIVATDCGAIPDFVINGVNGYRVAPFDVEGLADRLSELIADPGQCRTLGVNGYHLARRRYAWENTAARMREYIEAALSDTTQPVARLRKAVPQ